MSTPANPPAPQQPPVILPPPPGPPVAPTPKKKSVAGRMISVVVAVAVAAGVYFVAQNLNKSEATSTKAGDCVSMSGTTSNPKFEKVGCDAANVTHIVGKSLGKSGESCGEPYGEYTETLDNKPVAKLCLVQNLVEGTCFKNGVSADVTVQKIECSQKDAVKVAKVIKGTADKNACPKETDDATVYPEPPTTHCLVVVG
jgi:hypothetical protein